MGEPMTDLEMTKLCAEAMGYRLQEYSKGWRVRDAKYDCVIAIIPAEGCFPTVARYWPLNDDAQAMALIKKLRLRCYFNSIGGWWTVKDEIHNDGSPSLSANSESLNRAIVECAAQLQRGKGNG